MATYKYKVGTGGHYTDWADVWNALVAVGALTNDYEFEQISDVTVTAWPNTTLLANQYIPNGHSVKFYCPFENSHQGNPNAGYRTYLSGANGKLVMAVNTANAGNFLTVENLNIVQLTNNNNHLLNVYSGSLAANIMLTVSINNILIKGFAGTNSVGLYCPGSQDYYRISNCKIWNVQYGLLTAPTVTGALLPYDNYANRNRYENISIFDTAPGAASTISMRSPVVLPIQQRKQDFYNCYSFNSATAHSWPSTISSTGDLNGIFNCADDDGRLAAAIAAGFTNYADILSNIPYLPEFDSVDDTDSRFLFLKRGELVSNPSVNPAIGKSPLRVNFSSLADYVWPTGMQLYNAGVEPILTADDISGLEYGKYGNYPIGCHNAELEL